MSNVRFIPESLEAETLLAAAERQAEKRLCEHEACQEEALNYYDFCEEHASHYHCEECDRRLEDAYGQPGDGICRRCD